MQTEEAVDSVRSTPNRWIELQAAAIPRSSWSIQMQSLSFQHVIFTKHTHTKIIHGSLHIQEESLRW